MNDVKTAREDFWFWRNERNHALKIGSIIRYFPFLINALIVIVAMVYLYINESNILIWSFGYFIISAVEGVGCEKVYLKSMKEIFEMYEASKKLYEREKLK